MTTVPGTEAAGSVGVVTTRIRRLDLPAGGLVLDNGQRLAAVDVAYETYGTLRPEGDNAVYICHALSGHAHAAGEHESPDPEDPVAWWDRMIGPGKGIDTNHYFVVCANVLGGCKGTTGPASVNPETGAPYGSSFPEISVGDIVTVHRLLLRELGVERLAAVVGGSFGGMQALEWSVRFPDMLDRCIVIASSASLSAQALAFDIVGRKAIMFDPDWQGGDYYGSGRKPVKGLSLARKVGHITYLSREIMTERFGREKWTADSSEPGAGPGGDESRLNKFQVQTYLEHQGEKFTRRFDANSYLHITRAMDEYDVAAPYGGLESACARIRAKILVVAVSSDWLFPPEQSTVLANALLRAGKPVSYCLLTAPHGHDAFLVDVEHLAEAIRGFLPWVGATAPVTLPRAAAAPVPSARPRPTRARGTASHRSTREFADGDHVRREFAAIAGMVRPGSRILDLGCGSGTLLTLLANQRQVTGVGVEIDIRHVLDVIDEGHDIFQADIDGGLAMVPDGAYDYAVLSETLQVVKRPRYVVSEMLRVAREGLISFPNFGNWRHRGSLCVRGRMPKGQALPYEWYDTPNIHLFTLRDFQALCREDGISILETVYLTEDGIGKALVAMGLPNLGANSVLVRIARGQGHGR